MLGHWSSWLFVLLLALPQLGGELFFVEASNEYKVCVVGGGPAGIQLSSLLSDAGVDSHVVLERAAKAASFFEEFPRHRNLISLNKMFTGSSIADFNLRHDWNSLLLPTRPVPRLTQPFTQWSNLSFPGAALLVDYMGSFAKDCLDEGKLQLNSPVNKIEKRASDGKFLLGVAGSDPRTLVCEKLIVAKGADRPVKLPIPGWEHVTLYHDIPAGGENFKNKTILLIGGGNSAHETAQALSSVKAKMHILTRNAIRISYHTHYVGDVRAVNNELLDTYQLNSMDALIQYENMTELAIVKCDTNEMGKTTFDPASTKLCVVPRDADLATFELSAWTFGAPYDVIVSAMGFAFDATMFEDSAKPKMRAAPGALRFPAQTCDFESVNVKNMYFGGTLMHSRDYRRASSGFVHGFRYTSRALVRNLARELVPSAPRWGVGGTHELASINYLNLAETIASRIQTSSGLYQVVGELVDVIVLGDNKRDATLYEEVPRCQACVEPVDAVQRANWEANHAAKDNMFCTQPSASQGGSPVGDDVDRLVVYFRYRDDFHGSKTLSKNRVGASSAKSADQSTFLHPVIEYWAKGDGARGKGCSKSLHLVEEVLAQWDTDEMHLDPMRVFLKELLGSLGYPAVPPSTLRVGDYVRMKPNLKYFDVDENSLGIVVGPEDPVSQQTMVRFNENTTIGLSFPVWSWMLRVDETRAPLIVDSKPHEEHYVNVSGAEMLYRVLLKHPVMHLNEGALRGAQCNRTRIPNEHCELLSPEELEEESRSCVSPGMTKRKPLPKCLAAPACPGTEMGSIPARPLFAPKGAIAIVVGYDPEHRLAMVKLPSHLHPDLYVPVPWFDLEASGESNLVEVAIITNWLRLNMTMAIAEKLRAENVVSRVLLTAEDAARFHAENPNRAVDPFISIVPGRFLSMIDIEGLTHGVRGLVINMLPNFGESNFIGESNFLSEATALFANLRAGAKRTNDRRRVPVILVSHIGSHVGAPEAMTLEALPGGGSAMKLSEASKAAGVVEAYAWAEQEFQLLQAEASVVVVRPALSVEQFLGPAVDAARSGVFTPMFQEVTEYTTDARVAAVIARELSSRFKETPEDAPEAAVLEVGGPRLSAEDWYVLLKEALQESEPGANLGGWRLASGGLLFDAHGATTKTGKLAVLNLLKRVESGSLAFERTEVEAAIALAREQREEDEAELEAQSEDAEEAAMKRRSFDDATLDEVRTWLKARWTSSAPR